MDENTPLLGESSRAVQRDGQDEAFHTEPSQSKPHPAAGPEASGSSSTIADIDERLRRWQSVITERFRKGKGKQTDGVSPIEPVALISVFQKVHVSGAGYTNTSTANQHPNTLGASTSSLHIVSNEQDIDAEVEEVRRAIDMGIFPQMIQTGSSGSYFARKVDADGKQETVAVFKPRDEEPYGDLNPKRVFLRRYFWWMMGRPCLVPNFSASSEAGASYLDSRLALHVVPPTHLVDLSSPSFFYPHADREAWRKHKKRPPAKIGSFQLFLRGYVNASEFLRKHPWPSRPPHLLEADLAAEQAAHKLSRKKKRAYMRRCFVAIKRCLLCRTAPLPFDGFEEDRARVGDIEQQRPSPPQLATSTEEGEFRWTPSTMRAFRIELEKLVVLDFLMRNTDRGLDNFMVRHKEKKDPANANGDMLRDVDFSIKLGAIDNSLSFPHRHPNGIRDYPFGWLWLPADLIGQPFSAETRSHFLPLLSDPTWWIETVAGLKRVFEQDENFSAKIFERQMAVMRGQGLNLVESLLDASEGPIELCARPRKLVYEEVVRMTKEELAKAAQSAIATLTLHDGAFVPGRPPFHHDHSSDTRDLHTVAERDASDLEDVEPDSNGQPSTSISVEGASQPTNAEADAVSEDPAAHLSPEAQPRSLPETDSAASFTAFAKWQSTQAEALEGDMADLALAQSMTGIEVLERELAASVHHDFGFLKRSRRSAGGSENDGNLRSTTVPPPLVRSPGLSPDEGRENSFGHAADGEQGRRGDAASPAEGDPGAEELAGSGGRVSSSRTRSRTMITGGFSRQITLRGRNSHQQQHSGETPYKSPSNFPRLTRSNSEHAGVLVSTASSGVGTRNLDLRPSLRKRMGSVGGWSITSLGSASGTVETAEGTESRQVKVIIQRAVHDPSRAFLRWY
ncbi:hypothetical protein A4X13_0g230 [Tilletia indica]|uniref:1-phosphatidylinositol 4-kinase n=1 Tax=Tilletia indica TaxID=43049 RepID=A0A177TW50_9BASI|nr:hypothetical protein A4X13_0g230 [Tilletia indica]